jgi:4-hydroxymandelate oxidase
MKRLGFTTRRAVLGTLGGVLVGPSFPAAQQDPNRSYGRVPGLDELATVMEFEAVAFAKLPREQYDYTSYGSEGEFTLRRNREAFEWVELVPRGVVDITSIQTATEILGTQVAFPLMVAPTGNHGELYRDGELATHKGCTAASNTPFIVSNAASFPMDKIAAAGTGPLWFQLFPHRDLDETQEMLEDALAAGCKAVVMTVDQQASHHERLLHDRNLTASSSTPGAFAPASAAGRATNNSQSNHYRVRQDRAWYDWKYADAVRAMVKVPLVAKGILTPEDARLFVEHGYNGIYVSNHGGRSLDYDPSTLEVLPEIVDAVRGHVAVLLDSGIRSGSDILKALALGAKAVCVGRAARWGLAAYGPAGVQRVLEILQAELVREMAQTGMPNLGSIDRTLAMVHFR